MMKITIKFYGIAYDKTGNREWRQELDEKTTIKLLLEKIVTKYPALGELVYGRDKKMLDYLAISVNNRDILGLNGFNTVLHDGDMVFIMPPIGGG